MKIWKDEEVKSLFKEVEECKKQNKALKFAFIIHAEKFKRKPNSVRNYYYHEVDNLKNDSKRCNLLAIDIEKHFKNHFVAFDKTSESVLLKQIDNLTEKGQSVRSACKELSGGDVGVMTRIQNKYQNLKRKNCAQEKNNIIMFRQKQKNLTENDITSLFLGLVKLIKKTAIDDFVEQTKLEKQSSAFLLKKALLDLGKKEKKIAELRADFEVLKSENEKLIERLNSFGSLKNQALKEHLSKKKVQTRIEN